MENNKIIKEYSDAKHKLRHESNNLTENADLLASVGTSTMVGATGTMMLAEASLSKKFPISLRYFSIASSITSIAAFSISIASRLKAKTINQTLDKMPSLDVPSTDISSTFAHLESAPSWEDKIKQSTLTQETQKTR